MKKLKQVPSAFGIAFTIVLVMCIAQNIYGQKQEKTEISKFLIKVETTKDGIKFTSIDGCAWIELSFSLPEGKVQAVDYCGMTGFDNNKDLADANHTGFLFTVKKTDHEISFEGLKGTAWEKLSFSYPKNYQAIDQYGMTDLASN